MAGFAGVTEIETRLAGVTVNAVVPDILPVVAVIVVVPVPAALARPFEPAALLIVATAVFDELQTTDAVRFWVVLSEYVPVAVNCLFVPLAILGLVGVTATETRLAGFTVSVVVPEMLPDAAVIVDEPASTAVASPVEPTALLIVATLVLEELQTTDAVRFWVVLSEYVPVAVNCRFDPLAMVELFGVIAIETSEA